MIVRAMEDMQKTKIECLEVKITMCEMKTMLDSCNGKFDIAGKKRLANLMTQKYTLFKRKHTEKKE